MRRTMRLIRELSVLTAIIVVLSYIALAGDKDPIGPEGISVIDSQRRDGVGGTEIAAEAGNVTELFINATSVTKSWAGFYGNITGYITLDDANNWTMYNWQVAEPQGEIYATQANPPVWASLDCLNHTSGLNYTELEENLSMEYDDVDGINDTFCPGCNASWKDIGGMGPPKTHPLFYVGTNKFSAGDCWAIATYVSDNPQSADPGDFVEVLLQDGTNAVYMSIIEDKDPDTADGETGFDGRVHDFQIIVGEDGNGSGMASTTPYYFYVELE